MTLPHVQLKGYNFDVLEEYQSWVHRMAENMGIDVSLAWATPAQSLDLTTYHVGGIRPKDTFNVQLYERNVQVANLRSIDAPVLLDVIQKALPEGVTLCIMEHTVEASEARWIADPFIDQLRSELADKEEYNKHFSWLHQGRLAKTKFFCRVCSLLHHPKPVRFHSDIEEWWSPLETCTNSSWTNSWSTDSL